MISQRSMAAAAPPHHRHVCLVQRRQRATTRAHGAAQQQHCGGAILRACCHTPALDAASWGCHCISTVRRTRAPQSAARAYRSLMDAMQGARSGGARRRAACGPAQQVAQAAAQRTWHGPRNGSSRRRGVTDAARRRGGDRTGRARPSAEATDSEAGAQEAAGDTGTAAAARLSRRATHTRGASTTLPLRALFCATCHHASSSAGGAVSRRAADAHNKQDAVPACPRLLAPPVPLLQRA